MRARVPWGTVVVSVVLAATDTVISAQYRDLLSTTTLSEHAWPAVTAAAVASTLMGALIVSRYPHHPVGWLLCAGGVVTSFSLMVEAYAVWVVDHGGPGSEYQGRFAGWLSTAFGAPFTLMTLTLIFLLAPHGHLPSRRWRPALWAAVAGVVLFVAAILTVPPNDFRVSSDQDFGIVTSVLSIAGIVATGAALIASVVSLRLRLRRAHGVERQQLRWMAFSAAALAGGFVFLLVAQAVDPGSATTYSGVPLYCAYFAFPVCTAVAVLRYRLFDLDLIISRALVVAIATATVAVGYVLVVIAISGMIGRGTDGFWPSLLATALVAMAFQPVRRGVVRLADRLAFGSSATPYEALADFARRLGESPDPTRLLPAVAEAAGSAVHARRSTVRLPVPGVLDHVGTWAAAASAGQDGSSVDVPVVDRGEVLGSITVEMPPGRALRDRETRLLRDLADQAAVAFRNARLTGELAHQVEQLDRRTSDLAESRRRLITAGDAERSRLERSIAREVVPHLTPLPALLEDLAGSANGTLDASRLQPLVASSATALEALREITRGVFPAQLARSGLESSLRSLVGRTGAGVLAGSGLQGRRLDGRVEAAAYFCVAEAVRDLDPPLEVLLDDTGAELRLVVRGCGGGHLSIANMRDRVEAVGGTVTVTRDGGSTVLDVVLPARSPAEAVR